MTAAPSNASRASRERGPSTRSAVLAGVVTVVVVAVMANLGLWQLRRHAEVRDQNVAIDLRTATEVPLEVALAGEADFQRVVARGVWQVEDEVLWRGRSRRGVTGFEVLTPLRLIDGSGAVSDEALLVDRGWVPDAFDTPPVAEARPPTGVVEVVGVLRHSVDQPGFGPQDPAEGRLATVFHADLPRIDEQVAADLVDSHYLRLERATPAAPDDVLRPLAPIEPDAGPHLGYALQWFGFSATAVAAYLAWLWSRVLRPRRA